MLAALKTGCNRLFADRHISVHRGGAEARQVTIPRSAQVLAAVAAIAVAGAAAQIVIDYVHTTRKVAAKAAEAAQAELSNTDLRKLAARLQDQLRTTKGELGETQARLATMAAENSSLRGRIYTAELHARTLEDLQERAAAERVSLDGKIRDLTTSMQDAQSRMKAMQADFERLKKKLSATSAERDTLRSRVAELERHSSVRVGSASASAEDKVAVAAPAVIPMPKPPRTQWDEFEELLASAGVDIDKVMARFGAAPPGQGGPFEALDPRDKNRPAAPNIARLHRMLKSLPLAAPLAHYQLTSGFGARSDPFNRKHAFHSGIDLAARFKSAVYNTAPGVVIYAGPMGDYGRVVEVDHGSGIVTRYAHLHRVMVVRGQRLTKRTQIGQVGSTGRSTGPHVHYEVRLNGTPVDPEKFLDAGKTIIPVSAKEAAR